MDPVLAKNWPLLFIPSICVNITVFLNSEMKDFSFKYMLASSFADFLYLGLSTFSFIGLCNDCALHNNFLTQVYQIWIGDYLTSCLAIFSIFVEITLSVNRYLILKNRKNIKKINHVLVIFFLFLLSLGYYLPILFF